MSNPWDVPPWPTRGDDDAEKTHAGIGGVISVWSVVESELSRLYTVFTDRYEDLEALMEFGDGTIFRNRFETLIQASTRYFIRCPNQAAEGDLHRISRLLLGFADRRNDIAHGVVTRVDSLGYFRERLDPAVRSHPNYMLLPPFHTRKKHDPNHGGPAYAYNYESMFELRKDLFTIAIYLRDYLNARLPPDLRDEWSAGVLEPTGK